MTVMRALVVFESMYGNTKQIAAAVAAGVATHMEVELIEVGSAPDTIADGVALLVAGSPTHAFTLSTKNSRRDAAKKQDGGVISAGTGMRDWLRAVHGGAPDMVAACFDTRFRRPRIITGSAARSIAKRLSKHHFRLLSSESFFVASTATGPLLEGEQDRARRWGETLGAKVAS